MDCCQEAGLAQATAARQQMAHRMPGVFDRQLETVDLVAKPPVQTRHHNVRFGSLTAAARSNRDVRFGPKRSRRQTVGVAVKGRKGTHALQPAVPAIKAPD